MAQCMFRPLAWLVLISVLLGSLPLATPVAAAPEAAPIPRVDSAQIAPALDPPIPVAPLAAEPFNPAPGLALAIQIAPDPLAVGETATLSVQIINRSPYPAENLVVIAPTPDGALAEAGPITVNPVAGWRWTVGHLDGNASIVVTGTLRLVRMPPGEALLASAEATADRVGTPARVQGGALAVDRTRGPADAAFTPGKSAKLRSQDGRVVVDLPANANARALTLRHTPNTGLGDNAPPDQPGLHRGLGQFTLTATDSAGNDVHQFDAPLTIAVSYTAEQLQARGIRDGDLGLFWFDETAQRWQLLPTEVDATNRIARATVDHFTPFQLSDLSSASTAYLPSLQGFQVSQFTGAATYRISIETPAGAAGLKPALDLSYSSATSDGPGGDRDRWQAGWAGKGWSLGAEGYVARDTSVAGSAWDHFSLVFAGESFDVVRGQLTGTSGCTTYTNTAALDCWTWHATDENFVRVRAVASGGDYIWKAWTQDGTRYDFTSVLYQQPDPASTAIQSYKWLLTQATDTHGNKITYTYTVATAPVTGGTVHPGYHLDEILWGYDGGTARYKAVFDTVARATSNVRGDTTQVDLDYEYPGYPAANAYWEPATPHEMYRLDQIEIMSKQAAAWELMWRYDLYYASTGDGSTPNLNADSLNGQEVLTLKQVQRIGKDGTTALPATSFTYYPRGTLQQIDAGGNRLKTVTNGQGGKLTFNYQRVWTAGSFGTEAAYYHENYHRVSQVTTESTVGIVTASATTYSYTNPARNDINYAATVFYAAYPPSGNGESRPSLARPEKREFRGHATVTEKVFADTNTGSVPLRITVSSFYQGNDPDPGGTHACPPNTTTVGGNAALVETDLCYVAMRENEAWKGRAYQVEVQTGAGVALQRTNHTFARVELPFFGSDTSVANSAGLSNNYKRAGLWRAFTPEIKTEERILNAAGTAALKTTLTYYNAGCTTDDATSVTASYGNVGCVLEQDGTTTERKTTRGYRVLNDSTDFFVRQTQEAIYDDSGFLKALTNMLYDGGSTQSSTLTNGDLTRQMRYFNIPAGTTSTVGLTLNGTDTTYTYDAFGNRLTETTYTSSSTRTFDGTTVTWGAPSGTARTTTYTYNATATSSVNEAYSGLPITIRNPLLQEMDAAYDYRMQSLTSVTDLNSVLTSAEYDAFGRQTKLIKNGDTSATPTVKATYFDSATPFRYTIEQREVAGQAGVRVTQLYYDGLGRQIQAKRESVDNAENVITDMRYDALGRVIEQSQPRKVAQTGTNFTNYTSPGAFTNPTATTYDALGRPIRITAPDNTWTEHLYGVVNNQVYDDVIDGNRHRTQQRTDVLGRRVQVYEVTGNCGTSVYSWATCAGAYTTPWATYSTTNYAYDALDQLTSATDELLNTTTMLYDSAGRKTRTTDRDMGQWNYTYDVNGNLTKQTDARGQVLCFYYDKLDRLTAKHQNGTTATCATSQPATPTMKYTYDENTNGIGYRTGMDVSGGASTDWTYDTRGRKTSATHTVPGLSGSRVFSWAYDSGDRLATLSYPTVGTVAETLTYSYDAAWHATQVCSSRVGQACYVGSATYTALDQPDSWTLGNSVAQDWAYDSTTARLSRLKIGSGTPASLFDRSYGYDAVDNVLSITDNKAATNSQTFTYDDLNRLNCWKLNSTSCSQIFNYNEIGNLTSKTGVGTYQYPASGASSVRPHTPLSVGGVTYSYDANGNLTGDGTRTLTWTAESLPNAVSYMSGTTSKVETSSYDADGERVKLAVTATPQNGTATTVSTVYLEGLWEEFVGGTTKVYYPFNGQMVALREVASATSNTLRYLHGDHIGSISISTDSAGGSVSSQEFDPWGKVRTGSVISTTLGFTGQRLDGSGLMYYHARMYNPAIGRFISADSVVPGGPGGSMQGVALKPLTVDFHEAGFVDGLNGENKQPFWFQLSDEDKQKAGKPWGPANPQALNRYSYVTNNPLRYTDPGGHFGVTIRENGTITFHLTHEEVGVLWGIATGTAMSTSEKLVRVVEFLKSLGAKWAAKLAPLLLGAVLGIVSDILFWGGLAMLAADYFYGSIGLDITMTRNGTIVGVGAPTTTRQHGIYVEIGVYDIWNKAYAPIFGPLPEGVHVVFPACSSFHINFCDDNPEAELNR